MMNVENLKCLLTAISRTLAKVSDFSVFEEIIEDDSYYTMSDLTMGDAIQALNEVVEGIENVNHPDQFSDLYLTSDLEGAITSLSELGTSIICADRTSRPCENKVAAKEVPGEKTEEMLAGWDVDKKYKYLCFYHKAFPFMEDPWGVDYSDSKQELLDAEWRLFSSQEVASYFDNCDEFQLVLNALATDPQFLICSDGEYVLYDRQYVFRRKYPSYQNTLRGWVCLPTKFSRTHWKNLSSQYRRAVSEGIKLHRDHLLCYTDRQFEIAQRLIRQVFGDEIATHEIKDEF